MNPDLYGVRLRSLEFAVNITPEGQTVAQLLADAAIIEGYLLGSARKDKKDVD